MAEKEEPTVEERVVALEKTVMALQAALNVLKAQVTSVAYRAAHLPKRR